MTGANVVLSLLKEFFSLEKTLFQKKLEKDRRRSAKQRQLEQAGPVELSLLVAESSSSPPPPDSFTVRFKAAFTPVAKKTRALSMAITKVFADQFNNPYLAIDYLESVTELDLYLTGLQLDQLQERLKLYLSLNRLQEVLLITREIQRPEFDLSRYAAYAMVHRHSFEKGLALIDMALPIDWPPTIKRQWTSMKADAFMQQGITLLREGKNRTEAQPFFKNAKEIYMELMGGTVSPESPDFKYYIELFFWMEDYQTIVDLLKPLIHQEPVIFHTLYMYYSIAALEVGDFDEAFTALDKLGFSHGFNPAAYMHFFHIFAKMGLVDEAFSAFTKGIEFASEDPQYFSNFFVLLQNNLGQTKTRLIGKLLESSMGDRATKALIKQMQEPQYDLTRFLVEPFLVEISESDSFSRAAQERAELLLQEGRKIWPKEEKDEEEAAAEEYHHWTKSIRNFGWENLLGFMLESLGKEERTPKKKAGKKKSSKPATGSKAEANKLIAKIGKKKYQSIASPHEKAQDYNQICELLFQAGSLTPEHDFIIFEYSSKIIQESLLPDIGREKNPPLPEGVYPAGKKPEFLPYVQELLQGGDITSFWTVVATSRNDLFSHLHFRGYLSEAKMVADTFVSAFHAFLDEDPDYFHNGLDSTQVLIEVLEISLNRILLIEDSEEKQASYEKALFLVNKLDRVLSELEVALEELTNDSQWKDELPGGKRNVIIRLFEETQTKLFKYKSRFSNQKMRVLNGLGREVEANKEAQKIVAARSTENNMTALTTAQAYAFLGRHEEAIEFILDYYNDPKLRPGDRLELFKVLAESLVQIGDFSSAAAIYFPIYNVMVSDSPLFLFELLKILLEHTRRTDETAHSVILKLFARYIILAGNGSEKESLDGAIKLPKQLKLDEDDKARNRELILEESRFLSVAILKAKEENAEFAKKLIVQLLEGPELPAQAFLETLQTTTEADWQILELLDSIKLKEPKGRGRQLKDTRRVYKTTAARLEEWKKAILERFGAEEPKKRRALLKKHFGNVPETVLDAAYGKIERPLDLGNGAFLEAARTALDEVVAEDHPHLPADRCGELLAEVLSGTRPYSDLAEIEEPYKREAWLKEDLGDIPKGVFTRVFNGVREQFDLEKGPFVEAARNVLDVIVAERNPHLPEENRREILAAVRSGEKSFAALDEEEAPFKRRSWVDDHLAKFPKELRDKVIARTTKSVQSELLDESDVLLDAVLAEEYPYLPEEKRKEVTAAIRRGKKPFSELAKAEAQRFQEHWENISDEIPGIIAKAKAGKLDQDSNLILIDRDFLENQRPLTEAELVDFITLKSLNQYIEFYLLGLRPLFKEQGENLWTLSDALSITKQSALLTNRIKKEFSRKVTYSKIRQMILADVIRNHLAMTYDFFGEELIDTWDLVHILETLDEGEPQLDETFLEKVFNLAIRRFQTKFPFYSKEPQEILGALRDKVKSAREIHAFFQEKASVTVREFNPTHHAPIGFRLVLDRKASLASVKLYFPVQKVDFDMNGGKEPKLGLANMAKVDVVRIAREREDDILNVLRDFEAQGDLSLTSIQSIETNFGPVQLLEYQDNWQTFLSFPRTDSIKERLGGDLKKWVQQAILKGKHIRIQKTEGNGTVTSKFFYALPLVDNSGQSKLFTVETNPRTGKFETAHLEESEQFLQRLLGLTYYFKSHLKILNIARESGATGIFIKPQPEEDTIYYENLNGLYGLRWRIQQSSLEVESFTPEGFQQDPAEAKRNLIDLSFLLNLEDASQQQETAPQLPGFSFFPHRLELSFPLPAERAL